MCVPTVFPQSVAATAQARCSWLKGHGYGKLKVNGRDDPLGLDPDHNGWACDGGAVRSRGTTAGRRPRMGASPSPQAGIKSVGPTDPGWYRLGRP
ncbi:hypothetical protein GCM10020000_55470 [Streptomyces olivoverticillatus]